MRNEFFQVNLITSKLTGLFLKIEPNLSSFYYYCSFCEVVHTF